VEALEMIAEHYPTLDPDGEYEARFEALRPEIDNCPECIERKSRKWPPSGLCNGHYSKWYGVIDDRDRDQNVRRWSEPKDIARRALATPASTPQEDSRGE
jgi:hypothetical protein